MGIKGKYKVDPNDIKYDHYDAMPDMDIKIDVLVLFKSNNKILVELSTGKFVWIPEEEIDYWNKEIDIPGIGEYGEININKIYAEENELI